MKKHFVKTPCHLCGKMISNAGFASNAHDLKHQREGLFDSRMRLTEAGRAARVEQSTRTKALK